MSIEKKRANLLKACTFFKFYFKSGYKDWSSLFILSLRADKTVSDSDKNRGASALILLAPKQIDPPKRDAFL